MSIKALSDFLVSEFPQTRCTIVSLGNREATVKHSISTTELRPGGTVSGPVLMETADVAMYVALLNEIGIVPLAVTTNLSINFLRKPCADRDIVAHCKLVNVGRTLSVGSVELFSETSESPESKEELIASASVTYAIPANR